MRRLEHVEAAKAEAIRLGASIQFEQGKKHMIGVIAFNGQQRKIFVARSKKTGCGIVNIVREDVRRKVKEMQR